MSAGKPMTIMLTNSRDSRGRRNPGAFLVRSRRHILGAILRAAHRLQASGWGDVVAVASAVAVAIGGAL